MTVALIRSPWESAFLLDYEGPGGGPGMISNIGVPDLQRTIASLIHRTLEGMCSNFVRRERTCNINLHWRSGKVSPN